jgi:hypothetical protein
VKNEGLDVEDEIGVLVEHLDVGWMTRRDKPELFHVAVSGRPYGDPHPILVEIFEILNLPQGGSEQITEFSSLRKKYSSPEFVRSLRRLQLNLSMGKMKEPFWEGLHTLCFEIE